MPHVPIQFAIHPNVQPARRLVQDMLPHVRILFPVYMQGNSKQIDDHSDDKYAHVDPKKYN